MLVDISGIIKNEGESQDFKVTKVAPGNDEIIPGFYLEGSIGVKGSAVNIDKRIYVTGNIEFCYRTLCARCLGQLILKQDIKLSETFAANQITGEDEIYEFSGNSIDIEKAVRDNIILNLPVAVICSKECKGLCVKCGKNLNEGDCDCKKDDIDPRMLKLKEFLKTN